MLPRREGELVIPVLGVGDTNRNPSRSRKLNKRKRKSMRKESGLKLSTTLRVA
jgi:hypothetical protein